MTKLYNPAFAGIACPRPPKLFSFNRRSFLAKEASQGCSSFYLSTAVTNSAKEVGKNFTFPKTCLPVDRCSEMTGCGSYFASRKSRYENFTIPKYSEMTGYSNPVTGQNSTFLKNVKFC
jgi:hypothetical protein